jgi:cellulose synthase/poly-beta-1,6-N-acetylglucosamine synthase-like glycosyltransferase
VSVQYSIIIPAYQASEALPRCLSAVQHQTIDPSRYEIIVVDDGSTDGTADLSARLLTVPHAQVIRAAHGGPAHARNVGAQAAQGEVLLFTDADCAPAPDWTERLTSVFAQPAISGAKGAYRTQQTKLVARFVQQEYQERYDRMLRQDSIDFIDTYSAAYRHAVFQAQGGFDTSYSNASVEDQEFSFRLAEQGQRLVFVPNAIVYHCHDETLREYARRKFNIGYWKALVLKQHPDKAVRDSHTPQVIKLQMALAAAALIFSLSALLLPSGWPIALGWWLALVVTMLPLLIKISRRDMPVVWIAPFVILLRAFSLGLGLAIGLLRFNLFAKRS